MPFEDSQKRIEAKKKLLQDFTELITPVRRTLLESRVQERTRYVTVVLEDLYQAHNLSAILRTCDCFGIQDIHIIEGRHPLRLSKGIVKGAEQWLTLKRERVQSSPSIVSYIERLRVEGYSIVATTPHTQDTSIATLPLDRKVALLFGTEREGLTTYAREHADAFVKVPMYGFTESFNVSVCAGIVLYELTKRLRESSYAWQLTAEEQLDLQLQWLIRTTPFGNVVQERLEQI